MKHEAPTPVKKLGFVFSKEHIAMIKKRPPVVDQPSKRGALKHNANQALQALEEVPEANPEVNAPVIGFAPAQEPAQELPQVIAAPTLAQ